MARAPRAKVPKTSGQGVSRLSYQKGYSLGNRGSGSARIDAPSVSADKSEPLKPGRKSKLEKAGEMNISYGETLPIGELGDIKGYAKDKAPKGLNLGKGKSRAFPLEKNSAGFLKSKGK